MGDGQSLDNIPKPQAEAITTATAKNLENQGIHYTEMQGTPPGKLDYQTEYKPIMDSHGVDARFLRYFSTDRMKAPEHGALSENDLKAINDIGKNGNVGLMVAGPERFQFQDGGMERFRNVYGALAKRTGPQDLDASVVFEVHVGEGYVEAGKNHKELGQQNVTKLLDTLEAMKTDGQLSDRVVLRLGHLTHASPQDLARIKAFEKDGVKIWVEANLGSNLVTGSVADENEQKQTLYKFLYEGIAPTLNTDGGGVMKTSIKKEYDNANDFINKFRANREGIVVGDTKYYFKELPDAGDIAKEPQYKHEVMDASKQEFFDMERIRQEANTYHEKVVPKLLKW